MSHSYHHRGKKRKGQHKKNILDRKTLRKLQIDMDNTYAGTGATLKEARNGCVSKVRFKSKRDVKNRADELGMSYYPCRFCGGWHLTRNNGGNKDGLQIPEVQGHQEQRGDVPRGETMRRGRRSMPGHHQA